MGDKGLLYITLRSTKDLEDIISPTVNRRTQVLRSKTHWTLGLLLLSEDNKVEIYTYLILRQIYLRHDKLYQFKLLLQTHYCFRS